jgi:general secretion pathway protein J
MHERYLPRALSLRGRPAPAGAARGFTLVELLVALFITAIVFAMGYSALSQALTSRKQVDEQATRLSDVQQAIRVIEQDFELLQPRPVRDLQGSAYLPPLTLNQNAAGGSGSSSASSGSALTVAAQQGLALLSLTRGSWANPAGLPRSELQRVSYALREGKLLRQYQPELDTTGAASFEERELLDQVESLSLRYMDASFAWYTLWPTPLVQRLPLNEQLRARPIAIEITLTLKDWGKLVRVIEVAG